MESFLDLTTALSVYLDKTQNSKEKYLIEPISKTLNDGHVYRVVKKVGGFSYYIRTLFGKRPYSKHIKSRLVTAMQVDLLNDSFTDSNKDKTTSKAYKAAIIVASKIAPSMIGDIDNKFMHTKQSVKKHFDSSSDDSITTSAKKIVDGDEKINRMLKRISERNSSSASDSDIPKEAPKPTLKEAAKIYSKTPQPTRKRWSLSRSVSHNKLDEGLDLATSFKKLAQSRLSKIKGESDLKRSKSLPRIKRYSSQRDLEKQDISASRVTRHDTPKKGILKRSVSMPRMKKLFPADEETEKVFVKRKYSGLTLPRSTKLPSIRGSISQEFYTKGPKSNEWLERSNSLPKTKHKLSQETKYSSVPSEDIGKEYLSKHKYLKKMLSINRKKKQVSPDSQSETGVYMHREKGGSAKHPASLPVSRKSFKGSISTDADRIAIASGVPGPSHHSGSRGKVLETDIDNPVLPKKKKSKIKKMKKAISKAKPWKKKRGVR